MVSKSRSVYAVIEPVAFLDPPVSNELTSPTSSAPVAVFIQDRNHQTEEVHRQECSADSGTTGKQYINKLY